MSHRRTNSLRGRPLSNEFGPGAAISTQPQSRRGVPRKALSVDTDEIEYEGSPRTRRVGGKPIDYASAAIVRIGSRGERIIQKFDEKCDDIENGPIAQSAKAKVQKAAEVIEERVLSHVRLPDEVQDLIYEIERTQAYQSARGKISQAYSYVEPILSRVNSLDGDDHVDFVIPPSASLSAHNEGSDRTDSPRPMYKVRTNDSLIKNLDVSQYPREPLPQIKVSDEACNSAMVSAKKDSLSIDMAPETGSLVSAADSDMYYEIIKPNKLYKTDPSPKPVPKRRRRSAIFYPPPDNLKAGDSKGSKESSKFLQVACPDKGGPGDYLVEESGRKVKCDSLGKRCDTKLVKGGQESQNIPSISINLVGNDENDPIGPKVSKVRGFSEEQLREQLKDKLESIVCINGKTYIIHQNKDDKVKKEVYGGASEFFEDSSGFTWEAVADVGGKDPSKDQPRWLKKFYNGLESFLTNAHDPWLSEADKDPLACECCNWLDTLCGGGPQRPGFEKRGNCITRHINQETFCVVSKRFRKNYVHRFSASKSLFCFSPWNPLRRAAIYLSTNQFFDYFVMGTILLNCVFLAMTKTVNEAEYIFLAIYTAEMTIKTVAKGFILNKYTYLRNPWNWLDFIVIASGYVTLIIEIGKFNVELGNLAGLRTFRVLRALKTVSIMPGLKTIINALLNSIKQLVEVMTLTVFCLMVFALFALQVYMGVLKNKCVLHMGPENFTDEQFARWINNTDHWFLENGTNHPKFGDPILCGNATGARKCPSNYTCLPDIGDNPNSGYTSFDNFLWSMLTTFQLITLDYWEDVYNKVIATGGPMQVVFFSIVVFFGSFYLINLMLAVVAMSYEAEAESSEEEKTKDFTDHRDDSTFSFDPEKLTHAKPLQKKKPKDRRVIVMRKGAGILSDSIAKKKRKRDSMASIHESDVDSRKGSSGTGRGTPPKTRPSSLVVSPPSVIAPTPSTPDKERQFGPASPEGPRRPGDGSCDPCSATSTRCCQCHCHSRQHEGVRGTSNPRCDDLRPHLRLGNNAANRQPSLDDSGVVGDHDGTDTISLHHSTQEKITSKGDSLYARRKCNGISPSSPAALSASSQHIVIYENELVDRNCEKCRNCCVNYRCWLKVQSYLYVIVHDACFDLFITLCIILNTIFLAVEHHGMSYTLNKVLEVGNRVFTAVFTLECIMKIMALSREFFVNRWNVFDLVIVLASLLDLGLEIGSGLSVLRGMRLLRVLKLAQSWRTMRVLLSIIISTLGALGNLTFVLIIIIYIFAVIGMQLFGKNYSEKNFAPDPIPRWNFTDFFHSFMMIFRILCGEWVEPLWDCMRAAGSEGAETCLAIFLPALVMGNFMILNLFLALLLNSFNSEELKSRQDDLEDESRVLALLVRIKNNLLPKRLLALGESSSKSKDEEPPDNQIVSIEEGDSRLAIEDKKYICQEKGMKQAFSEPEIHLLSQQDDDDNKKKLQDPQRRGYERMVQQADKTLYQSLDRPKVKQKRNDAQSHKIHDEPKKLDNSRGQKLLIKRRIKKGEADEEVSEVIELSEFKNRQLPVTDIRRQSPPRGTNNYSHGRERRSDSPDYISTTTRAPTSRAARLPPTPDQRTFPHSSYLRSRSPFSREAPHRFSYSDYKRRPTVPYRMGARTNSDPVLDSPLDMSHFATSPLPYRKFSQSPPLAFTNTNDPYYSPVPPHASSPDYRLRRNFRGEYGPIYAKRYYDYRDDYLLDYREEYRSRFYDRLQEEYIQDTRRNYGYKPLDYREQDFPSYSKSFRDSYKSDLNSRYDYLKELRHSLSQKTNPYQNYYANEQSLLDRDAIDDFRSDFYSKGTNYTDYNYDDYVGDSYTSNFHRNRRFNKAADDYFRRSIGYTNEYRREYDNRDYYRDDYRRSQYEPREYNYNEGYTQERSQRSYDQPRRQLPETNVRDNNFNEDSVSEVNYSEGYLPKLKLNQKINFDNQGGSADDLPELALDSEKQISIDGDPSPELEDVDEDTIVDEKEVPKKQPPRWGAVIHYVDEITTGVKDDDDPRFQRPQKKKKEPANCFPNRFYEKSPCCQKISETPLYEKWFRLRRACLKVSDSPYFEYFILVLIFASSITLCFEDIHLDSNPDLKAILNILNTSFAILFTVEMLMKWIAFGFVKYYSSVWTILDCFIVMVSLSSLFIKQDNLIALRSLRTLRALRPLRAISRWQGMKIVVNALMYAIPSIFNVLLVCLVFWLIFSIMGVQTFGGKFYKCIDLESGDRVPITIVNNKTECENNSNFTWVNSKINFDHVGYAYLALFQVATFEGWMEVMRDAVDCRGIDMQPHREANIYAYIYFVIFIVCGSFFTLNLFIGVIIDNFNMLKKKYEGGVLEMFLTDSQKNYYTAMKKLGRKKPQKVIRRPQHHYHAIFYDIAVSRRFEISIFVLIFLNMVTMAIEHHHQSRTVTFTLEVFNALFTTIFGLEAIVKIIGLRHHYFTVPWNLFDFILVFASIMGIVLQDVLTDFPVSPTLLRVVRVFRIGRILRLIKPSISGQDGWFEEAAKGIRKLLFALIVSLPALFNIGALLFLITFIYAIIGMAVFGHVQRKGALDDLVNFETFGSSMMLLFRLITSAGWNDVLDPLMAQPPDCDPTYRDQPNGNCGHPIIAISFFVSFIIINFMIVINMYIAVILENFNQAHKEEEIGIVEDDLEMFYVRWSKYDPHATQFISFSQLSDFIASLDAPFGIPKPNTVALVSFDLPIAKDDKIHCLDILHALTKHVLGHVEETEEFKRFPPQLKMQMEEKFKKQFPTRKELEIVSSTRRWKKMDSAAKSIQRSWKQYQKKKRESERKNLLLEEAQTQTSSPGGSSIKSGFRKVSNLLQIVPMPMSMRRRSVTVLQVDKDGKKSRRSSRASGDKTPSPRGSFFLPLSRRASRASISSLISNSSQISVQIHQAIETKNKRDSYHKHDPS